MIWRFQVADNKIRNRREIHRSGFTGELGYEVYCAMEDTAAVGRHPGERRSSTPGLTMEVYVYAVKGCPAAGYVNHALWVV